ncbi:15025_t:CDS:2 [Cetraspora pellucida]|uniref:15025_t:CDS:1 n=1 Tax=Cetraspora pellucida TaxID=1433469 RepID=A0A9N9IZZ6_9GLOM|nr:15025_t:CDS:2 [Cetraspora pellucida]
MPTSFLIMQNVGNITPEQNTPKTENVTPEQNLPSTPKANEFEFYDKKRKWYRVKEDFCILHNKYHFIKANNGEKIIEAYKRINNESEAIAKKTNSRIDICKSENYTLTTIKFFKETTLAPQKSEKITTTGALIFAERYEEKANQYDFYTINSSFTEKWSKFPYRINKATIEGNPPKKSLQCMKYLHYNLYKIYTHYDLECVRKNGLKVTLMNILPNAFIYERNVCITEKDMFGEWDNILYKIKKEGEIEEKVTSARKRISEIVKPLGDQVKCIYTDGFIIAGKVELKTEIEISELKFEKNGQNTILDTEYPASQIAKRKLSKKSDINLLNKIIIEIFQHL